MYSVLGLFAIFSRVKLCNLCGLIIDEILARKVDSFQFPQTIIWKHARFDFPFEIDYLLCPKIFRKRKKNKWTRLDTSERTLRMLQLLSSFASSQYAIVYIFYIQFSPDINISAIDSF